ncbi:MAG: hypothetical protein Q9169_002900 [Polycauliona sp. 2 TL-2023]
MSLQIRTNCVRNSAGGTITGIISVDLTNPLEIEHLAIVFSGRAQTDIDQSTNKAPGCIFQGQRLLFATRKTLIQKPTVVQKSFSWPFEFHIPERCTAREAHTFRPFERFDSDAKQQLPPAFASSYNKADGTHAANAAVIYELGASLLAKDSRLQAVEPMHFISTRRHEHPDLGKSAAHAPLALANARLEAGKSLRFRRSLGSTLETQSLPFAAVGLVLRGFNRAIIGQAFPLQLGVRHVSPPGSVALTQGPAVYLEKLKLILKAHNSIRCSGLKCYKQSGCNSIHKGDEFEDWDEEFVLESCDLTKRKSASTNCDNSSRRRRRRRKGSISERLYKSHHSGVEIPTTGDATGLDLQRYTTIPSYFVPSFKSHIISRTYTLETRVVVRCADQDFPITFVGRDFELLAQDFAGEGDRLAFIFIDGGSKRVSLAMLT